MSVTMITSVFQLPPNQEAIKGVDTDTGAATAPSSTATATIFFFELEEHHINTHSFLSFLYKISILSE